MPLLPGGEIDLQQAIFEAVQQSQLRLVGSNGEDRAVGRAAEIAVGLSSLRLLLPGPIETDTRSPQGRQRAESGAGQGGGGVATEPREVSLSFSVNTSVTAEKKNLLWKLLDQLTTAVDDEKVTHLRMTLNLVVDEDVADEISKNTDTLGIQANRVDM